MSSSAPSWADSWGPSLCPLGAPRHLLPGVAQRGSQGVRLGDVFPSLSSERLAHRAAVGTKHDHSNCTLGPGIAGIAGTCPPPILTDGKAEDQGVGFSPFRGLQHLQ